MQDGGLFQGRMAILFAICHFLSFFLFQISPKDKRYSNLHFLINYRSSYPRCPFKQGFFQKIRKIPRKITKTLLKRLRHRYNPANFAKFLRTIFLQNTSVRLLQQLETFPEKRLSLSLLLRKWNYFDTWFVRCRYVDKFQQKEQWTSSSI